MMRDDFSVSDHIMDCFFRARGYLPAEPVPPRLTVVTPENAAQFAQAPKARGRPRKLPMAGNVVPLSPRPRVAVQVTPEPVGEHAEVCRRFGLFVDRLEAIAKRKAAQKAPRK